MKAVNTRTKKRRNRLVIKQTEALAKEVMGGRCHFSRTGMMAGTVSEQLAMLKIAHTIEYVPKLGYLVRLQREGDELTKWESFDEESPDSQKSQ